MVWFGKCISFRKFRYFGVRLGDKAILHLTIFRGQKQPKGLMGFVSGIMKGSWWFLTKIPTTPLGNSRPNRVGLVYSKLTSQTPRAPRMARHHWVFICIFEATGNPQPQPAFVTGIHGEGGRSKFHPNIWPPARLVAIRLSSRFFRHRFLSPTRKKECHGNLRLYPQCHPPPKK